MSENISNSLSLFIDKFDISKIVNKIDKIKNCAIGFGLFTLISCLLTFENYRNSHSYNYKVIQKINDKNKITETKINELIDNNKKIFQILEKHDKMLDDILQNTLLNLSNKETLTNCLLSLNNLNNLINLNKSNSLIIPLKSEEEENKSDYYLRYYNDEEIIPTNETLESTQNLEELKNEALIKEDYELLNECYDSFPCNNSKKVSSANKLFNWN
jgi:hypothetical protein